MSYTMHFLTSVILISLLHGFSNGQTINKITDEKRWYWSFNDPADGMNNPMSTDIQTLGTGPDIFPGVKDNCFRAHASTYAVPIDGSCLNFFNCTRGISVAFWLKADTSIAATAGAQQIIVSSGEEDPNSVGFLITTTAHNATNFTVTVSASDASKRYTPLSVGDNNPKRWTHFLVIIDAELGDLEIWINAKLSSQEGGGWTTRGSPPSKPSTKLAIGASVNGGLILDQAAFLIDELHLLEDVLGVEEINLLYVSSAKPSKTNMLVTFDYTYENDIAFGERFIRRVAGNITETPGRYGKGWQFDEGAFATLGNFTSCFGYPLSQEQVPFWCPHGFSMHIWLKFPKPDDYTTINRKYVFGNIGLEPEERRSGFLVHVSGQDTTNCRVDVLIRTKYFFYEIPMHGRMPAFGGASDTHRPTRGDCHWDVWEMYIITFDPTIVGMSRYFSGVTSLHSTVSLYNTDRNYFTPSNISDNLPSELLLGHPHYGTRFYVDNIYISEGTETIKNLDALESVLGVQSYTMSVLNDPVIKFSPISPISYYQHDDKHMGSHCHSGNPSSMALFSFYPTLSIYGAGVISRPQALGFQHPFSGANNCRAVDNCNRGLTVRFWALIRNFGFRESLNDTETVVLADGYPQHASGGFSVLFYNGSLHVTVTTSRRMWHCDYPWGLNQWFLFTLTWHMDVWFVVRINGQEMAPCRDVTRRVMVSSGSNERNVTWGRAQYHSSDYEDHVGVLLTDIHFFNRTTPYAYTGAFTDYPNIDDHRDFPNQDNSRYSVNISNTLNGFLPDTNILNGTLRLYLRGAPADLETRSKLYGNSVILNGVDQHLVSDAMYRQCLTNPDICTSRVAIISFWVKPMAIPSTRKQTYMWIGRPQENVTVFEVYHQDGSNVIIHRTSTYENKQVVELLPELWYWVAVHIKLPSSPSDTPHMNTFINADERAATGGPYNSNKGSTQGIAYGSTPGYIVLGAAGDVLLGAGDITSSFGAAVVDDVVYKESYDTFRQCNWFGESFDLLWPLTIYTVDSCEELISADDEVDMEFPMVFMRLPHTYYLSHKIYNRPYNLKRPPFPVKCKTYAQTGIVETILTPVIRYGSEITRTRMVELNYFGDRSYYNRAIDYRNALRTIVRDAAICSQSLSYNCSQGAELFPKRDGTYWQGMWGNYNWRYYYWAGADPTKPAQCECAKFEECRNTSNVCNCDGNFTDGYDTGYIKDKYRLPVWQIRLQHVRGKGTLKVGDLVCANADAGGYHWSLDNGNLYGNDITHWAVFNGNWSDEKNHVPGVAKAGVLLEIGESIALGGKYLCFNDVIRCIHGFTFLAWFKFELQDELYYLASSMVRNSAGNGRGFEITIINSTLTFEVRRLGEVWILRTSIAAGVWNHIVASWSLLTDVNMYLNGIYTSDLNAYVNKTSENSNPPVPNPGSILLGATHSGEMSTGLVAFDEIRFTENYVYNRNLARYRYKTYDRIYRTKFDDKDSLKVIFGNSSFRDDGFKMNIYGSLSASEGPVDGAQQLKQFGDGSPSAYLQRFIGPQCLGQIGNCYNGMSLSFWLKLNDTVWDEKNFSYTILSAMSEDFGQGLHIHTFGRQTTLEIRNALTNVTQRSYFPVPIGQWFHFGCTWMPNQWADIYVNGIHMDEERHLYTNWTFGDVARPTGRNTLYIGWSPLFPLHTPMALDDLYFYERKLNHPAIHELFDLGRKQYNLDFAGWSSFDVSLREIGSPRVTHGVSMVGIDLDKNAHLKSRLPFYLNCLVQPQTCRKGFAMSLWMFLRPTSTFGDILRAMHGEEMRGVALSISNVSSTEAVLHSSILDTFYEHSAICAVLVRKWVYLAMTWSTEGEPGLITITDGQMTNCTSWTNNSLTHDANYTAEVEDSDVHLFLGGGTFSSVDLSLDEFHFREWTLTHSEIWTNYENELQNIDAALWSFDGSGTEKIIMEHTTYATDGVKEEYIEGVYSNTTYLNGADAYINIGTYRGSCLTQLEYCQTLLLTFYLKLMRPTHAVDQYVLASTDNSSNAQGIYIRHGNLNNTLWFRRYLEVSVKYSNRIWTGYINYEADVWAKLEIEWSRHNGLFLMADDQLATWDLTGHQDMSVGIPTDPIPVYVGASPGLNLFAEVQIDELFYRNDLVSHLSNVTYLAEDLYYLGCFLGTIFSEKAYASVTMDPRECRQYCNLTYHYSALAEGVRCMCFTDLSSMTALPDAFCPTPCTSTSHPCGDNTDMYRSSVYRTTAHLPFLDPETIENCTITLEGPYQAYFLTSTLVDATFPFNISVDCLRGSHIIYNFTFGDDTFVMKEYNNDTHIYSNIGVYPVEILLHNEISFVSVSIDLISCLPGFPIFNISSVPIALGQPAMINITIASTTALECVVQFGDGQSQSVSQATFLVEYQLQHTYLAPVYHNVLVNCSNTHSDRNMSHVQIVEEAITGLTTNASWVFEEFETPRQIAWEISSGTHVVYNLTLMNTTVIIPTNQSGMVDPFVDGIGQYNMAIIAYNHISLSEKIQVMIVIQRFIIGLKVGHARFQVVNEAFDLIATVDIGSHLNIRFKIDSQVISMQYGEYINGTSFQFNHIFPTTGHYTIQVEAWNGVTSVLVEESVVTVEERVPPISIDTVLLAQPFLPFQVNASGALTNYAHLRIQSDRTGSTSDADNVTCYESYHDSFMFLADECVIPGCGIYNISATLYNNVSSSTDWWLVELRGNITGVEFTVNHTILPVNDETEVWAKAEGDPGILLIISWGDGVTTNAGQVTPGVWTTHTHTYIIDGDFNITVTATNQIQTKVATCERCLSVQEPISDVTVTPIAFRLGSPVLITWLLGIGSHSRGRAFYDSSEVMTTEFSYDTGWMAVAPHYGHSLGLHQVDLMLWNDISGPVNHSHTIYILLPVTACQIATSSLFIATNATFPVSFLVENGTMVELNLTTNEEQSHIGSDYLLNAENTNRTIKTIGVSNQGTHELRMNATNLLGSIQCNAVTVQVEDPIETCMFTVTNVTSHLTPVQAALSLDMLSPPQPGLQIVSSLGDGISKSRASLLQDNIKSFAFSHQYADDGYYNVNVEAYNNVSKCEQTVLVQVGETIEDVYFSVDKYLEATSQQLVFNLTVISGTKMVATFNFGDGSDALTLACVRGTPIIQPRFYFIPGEFNVTVLISNRLGTVPVEIGNAIMIQERIAGFQVPDIKYYQAVNESSDIFWQVMRGSHITCQLLYDGAIVSTAMNCNASLPVVVPGDLVTGPHTLMLKVWNLVTPPTFQVKSINLQYRIRRMVLVADRTAITVNSSVTLNITIEEGSSVSLRTFMDDSEINSASFTGTSDHFYTLTYTFLQSGVYNLSAIATNVIGDVGDHILVTVRMPIMTAEVVVTEAEDINTPAVFTLRLNRDPGLHYATFVNHTIHFGDGHSCISSDCFTQEDDKTWTTTHLYKTDGEFTVSVNSSNDLGWIVTNATVLAGTALVNYTVICQTVILPTFGLLKCTIIITDGSFGYFELRFSDGEIVQSECTRSSPSTVEKAFSAPGIYWFDVRGWTIYNQLVIGYDQNITVMDYVRGISFSSPQKAYSTHNDTTIMLNWDVRIGEDTACLISTGNTVLYNETACEQSESLILPNTFQPGNYTLEFTIWNPVTPSQTKTAVIRIEVPILDVSLSSSSRAVRANESFTIDGYIGNGTTVTLNYESLTLAISEYMYIPRANGIGVLSRTYIVPEAMVCDFYLLASNVLGTGSSKIVVGVQGPIEGLSAGANDVPEALEKTMLTIKQVPGHPKAVFMTINIDWGDGKNDTVHEVTIDTSSPAVYKHIFQEDGIYTIHVHLANDIDEENLQTTAQVGQTIHNPIVAFEKDIIMPNELVKMCLNISSGSNITMNLTYPDDRPALVRYVSKTQCLDLKFIYQGVHDIYIIFSNYFTTVSVQTEICVEDRLSGMNLIVPSSVVKGIESPIGVSFYKTGLVYCVLLDLNETDAQYVFGGIHCIFDYPNHIFIEAFENQTEFLADHAYMTTGTYIVKVLAHNKISREFRHQDVHVIVCNKPKVTIHGQGKRKNKPTSYYRSHPITVEVQVVNLCHIPWPMYINWTVDVIPEDGSVAPYVLDTEGEHEPYMQFPSRLFPYGSVEVSVFVQIRHYKGISNTDVKYLQITATPLRVSIKGGAGRIAAPPKSSHILIDARGGTYDPDFPLNNAVAYTWMYRRQGSASWLDISVDDTFLVSRRKRSLSDPDNGVIYLSPTLPFGVYEFLVKALLNGKKGSFTQTVNIVPQFDMLVEIECISNCDDKVTVSDKIKLRAICLNCPDEPRFDWGLKEIVDTNTEQPVLLDGRIGSASDSDYLVILPDTLQSGKQYIVKVALGDSYNELLLRANLPPYGGSCYASPPRGVAMFTKYVVTCEGWMDEGLQTARDENEDRLNQFDLRYEYYMRPRGSGGDYMVFHQSQNMETPETHLTMGFKTQQYNVDILVKVFDRYNAWAEFTTTVQVGEFYLNKDELMDKVSGNVTDFDFHLESHDVQSMGSTVSSYIEQLIRMEEISTCELNGADADVDDWGYDNEFKTKIRLGLIGYLLQSVPLIRNFETLVPTSQAVEQCSSVTEELTPEAIERLLEIIDATSLKAQYMEGTPAQYQTFVKHLIATIDDVIIASRPDRITSGGAAADDELISQRKLAKQTVSNALEAISRLRQRVAQDLMPGEEPYVLDSDLTGLQIQKIYVDSIFNQQMTLGNHHIHMPSGSSLLGKYSGKEIDVQLTTFRENVFTWDDSAAKVHSEILGLQLVDPGQNEISVSRLSEPILLTIPSTRTQELEPIVVRISHKSKTTETMIVHNVSLTDAVTKVQIILTPARDGQQFELYLSYDTNPSETLQHIVIKMNAAEGYSTVIDPNIGSHTLFVGVKDVSRESYQPIEYTFRASTHSCMFWHQTNDVWSTEGCVPVVTSGDSLACGCTHLTFFGGDFYVPPNTIDFDTVFAKFAGIGDNLAVLVLVICLVVVYWIVVLVLRRLDKKDAEKWAIRPLLDNSDYDEHQYILTVITGNKWGAGTRSKVSFIFVGDDGDSDVRHLDDGFRKELSKGSISRYVLTTAASLGRLTYLRIWTDGMGGGRSASWFLQDVILHDVHTGDTFKFVCDSWLATDRGDFTLEKLFEVAPRAEAQAFTRVFSMSSRLELRDQHLWLSVLSKPLESNFTRVQRWSCCLCLLFTSMIASAMWFNTIEDSGNTGQAVKFGPIVLSTKELYVSAMATLVVLPINFIIIQLFRKSGKKESKCETSETRTNSTSADLSRNRIQPSPYDMASELDNDASGRVTSMDIHLGMTDPNGDQHQPSEQAAVCKKGKCQFTLPYWCAYIAWILCFLATTASAFFVILYSVEWGKDKSHQWLTTNFIRFFQSVFILQPLKVLVISVLIALILKEPFSSDSGTDDKDILNGKYGRDSWYHRIRIQRSKEKFHLPALHDDLILEERRQRRKKEQLLETSLYNVVRYCIYIVVITVISYGQRDPMAFRASNHLDNSLNIGPEDIHTFNKVRTIKAYKYWVIDNLLPSLFPTVDYTGNPVDITRNPKMSFDGEYYRLGKTVIRQQRAKGGGCRMHPLFHYTFEKCNEEYSGSGQDQAPHSVGWDSSNPDNDSSPWVYQETPQLPYWGQFHSYTSGGYLLEIPEHAADATTKFLRAYGDNWLDKYTRVLFSEFTLYNADANLFVYSNYLLELSAGGIVQTSHDTNVMTLYNYSGNFALFRAIAEILFVIYFIYNLVQTAISMKKYGRAALQGFWVKLDLIVLVCSEIGITLYILRLVMTKRLLNELHQSNGTGSGLDFSHVSLCDQAVTIVISLLVFLASVRMLYLLNFNIRVRILMRVLQISWRALLDYSFVFAALMAAFSTYVYVVFGPSLLPYSTFWKAVENLLAALVGGRMFSNTDLSQTASGRFFFVSFIGSMIFLMTNVLISILTDAMKRVQTEMEGELNRNEFVAFMGNRVGDLLGIDWNRSSEKRSKEEQEAKKQPPPVKNDLEDFLFRPSDYVG